MPQRFAANGCLLAFLTCLVMAPAQVTATQQSSSAVMATDPAASAVGHKVSPYALAARRQAQAQALARSANGAPTPLLMQHRPRGPVNRGLRH